MEIKQRYKRAMNMQSLISLMVTVGVGGLSAVPASAASSEWFKMIGGEMRLVTAATPNSSTLKAALEIRLKKGWKTYWRSPGESGIPPQFSFIASKNVVDTKVSYPSPSYYTDFDTKIVGYKNRVIFPISVTLGAENTATELDLSAFIGICEEVCVPGQAHLKVSEPGTASPTFDVLGTLNDGARALPGKASDSFKVISANWTKSNPKELTISGIIPESDDAHAPLLLVEGPDDWYMLPAKLTSLKNNRARFELDITDIPKDANPLATELRFTLVADGHSVEQLLTPKQCTTC